MISRYSRESLTHIWSDQNKYDTWLLIELAVCRYMEKEGSVPQHTASIIEKNTKDKLSVERILDLERTVKHDVIAFLTHVEELSGDEGRWLHLGLTSSDVLDTSFGIRCRDALCIIEEGVSSLRDVCLARAREHKHTPIVGRSHGIHAEPTSLGLTFARWYAELGRVNEQITNARQNISVGKIAGAVGTYATISPTIESEVLTYLGLNPETVPTQVVGRDRYALVTNALALLGSVIEQMAVTIRHWQRTEVGEAEEGFSSGQKGSSAMPHKRNPIASENITGLARMLRMYAGAVLENVALWHERDISHSSVERVVFPDATTLADYMITRCKDLLQNLVIHSDRMRNNLEITEGMVFSQAVLLALIAKGKSRQEAYVIVQRAAFTAWDDKKQSFKELLEGDKDVTDLLGQNDIDKLFDVDNYLRHVDLIYRRSIGE